MDTIKTSSGRLVPINPDNDADVSRHINDPTGCAECIITQINSEGLYDEYLKDKSDLVILDIGANVGFFSMYAQDSARRVISVEPTPSHQNIFEKITKSATQVNMYLQPIIGRHFDFIQSSFFFSDSLIFSAIFLPL